MHSLRTMNQQHNNLEAEGIIRQRTADGTYAAAERKFQDDVDAARAKIQSQAKAPSD